MIDLDAIRARVLADTELLSAANRLAELISDEDLGNTRDAMQDRQDLLDYVSKLREQHRQFLRGLYEKIRATGINADECMTLSESLDELIVQRAALREAVTQAANALHGYGMEDQGHAYDAACRILDAALERKP